jgi:hypothetical protein
MMILPNNLLLFYGGFIVYAESGSGDKTNPYVYIATFEDDAVVGSSTDTTATPSNSNSGMIIGIVVGVVGGLLVLAGLITLIVFAIRREDTKEEKKRLDEAHASISEDSPSEAQQIELVVHRQITKIGGDDASKFSIHFY